MRPKQLIINLLSAIDNGEMCYALAEARSYIQAHSWKETLEFILAYKKISEEYKLSPTLREIESLLEVLLKET